MLAESDRSGSADPRQQAGHEGRRVASMEVVSEVPERDMPRTISSEDAAVVPWGNHACASSAETWHDAM